MVLFPFFSILDVRLFPSQLLSLFVPNSNNIYNSLNSFKVYFSISKAILIGRSHTFKNNPEDPTFMSLKCQLCHFFYTPHQSLFCERGLLPGSLRTVEVMKVRVDPYCEASCLTRPTLKGLQREEGRVFN